MPRKNTTVCELPLERLRTDGDTQPRSQMNEEVAEDYAQEMRDGVTLPPVDATFDGDQYWLWDGFHRLQAAKKAGKTTISVTVTPGTVEDARWLALAANKNHGLRRSNEDKKLSVEKALRLWPDRSDHVIAEHVGVNHSTVSRHRALLPPGVAMQHLDERTGRDGKTYKTGKRGKRGKQATGEGPPPVVALQQLEGVDGQDERIDPAALELLRACEVKLDSRQAEAMAAVPQAVHFEVASILAEGQAKTVHQAVKLYEESINPEVPRDPAGLPVSGDAAAVLQTLALYREALHEGRKLGDLIHRIAIAPGGHFLRSNLRHRGRDPENLRHHSTDLDQVMTDLKFCQPYCARCPYCHHAHPGKFAKKCEACYGLGWVTKTSFDTAPADYREAVLKGAAK
jgi:hypothetical protein